MSEKMSSNYGKQPNISKFFLPVKNSKCFTTDEVAKKQTIVKKNVLHSLKRTSSHTSNGDHSKRAKVDHQRKDLAVSSSDIPKSFQQSPSHDSSAIKHKLSAFRSNINVKVTDESESENASKQLSQSQNNDGKLLKFCHGVKYTPLETQVIALKNSSPDTVLFVECGYKYRFFGEDAEIAAKELNIVAHLDHNFQTASIPTHRLHVHVRRLVAKGYKVGVVKQTETAALKAIGSNKTAPFSRELTAVYTKATLIGEDVTALGNDDNSDVMENTNSSLIVLLETEPSSKKIDKEVGIALVAVQPNTGEILFDFFDDSITRTGLWGRLEHIHPVEVILAESVSNTTSRTISAVTTRHGDCIRTERLTDEHFEYSLSLKELCQLFEEQEKRLSHIITLPHHVIRCLGATLHYLKEFRLERVLKAASSISQYSSDKQFMKLPGATLQNLEVVVNSDGGQDKGCLLWILNHTYTKFGARTLWQWLVQPLVDIEKINERQDMVHELMTSETPPIMSLKNILSKLPDFQKSLTTISVKKCSPLEFWTTTSGLSDVHNQLSSYFGVSLSDHIESGALIQLITTIFENLSDIHKFSENIDRESAVENNKTKLLKDWSKFEEVVERQGEINEVEMQLRKLRSQIGKILETSSFEYTTVSGLEYLIEVKNKNLKNVPSSWNKINSTKTCCRFRSPEVEKYFTKLQQLREQLQQDCHNAWLSLLDEFCEHFQQYREAVKCLGSIDALLSLAKVASDNGYCRPEFVDSSKAVLTIEGGKHPIVSQLQGSTDLFVANDTDLKSDGKRVMVVTGPNMGGKSCYMRQVALIALMAQVGSYVPAKRVRMSIIDGIFTRMGATDEIFSGKSTFMIEVGETADIMQEATDKSLVILDELGRGTSTHDGVAIAMSALDYFLKSNCLLIFVTHYLPLTEFETLYPEHVSNYHMSFIVNEEGSDGVDAVTFLYQLTLGSAGQSYGLNVARLADVPNNVISRASEKSRSLEDFCSRKRRRKEQLKNLFIENPKELRTIIKNM